MKVTHYLPEAVVTFYTESGELIARASGIESKKFDDDVISIQTVRDMGADAPTFSINLVNRKPWQEWVTPNDMVTITMCRPPEAKATVFFGLVDDIRKKVVMASSNSQRVVTVTGRGMAKAFIQFDVGHVPEVEYQDNSIGWLYANNVVIAGKTGKEVISALWDNIAKKHVNYKWENGQQLFDVITHNLTARPGLTLLDSAQLINWQGSMWSFIKEIADEPFNEVYWEIEEGKPTLIHRPTPFSQDIWINLPVLEITDEEVNIDSIGRSDVETYTLFSVGAKALYADADVFKTFGIAPLWYKPYAAKYGIRRLHFETLYAAMGSENDLNSTDALITLRDDLYNWNVKNNSMFNGSFTVKGSNRFKIGHRLKYNDMEYYITRVVHSFINFGSWTTEIGVVRGMTPAERFKVPYGAGTEYTGLGMVPYNPAEARRATQASKYLVNPISGTYLTKAQDVVAGAQYLMEQGTVRYVFGADNVGAGKLDCSSFTQYIYKTYAGMAIGRTTGNQVTKGVEVKKADLMAGDLVFFKNTYNSPHVYGVSHVGIYIGNGQFIHNSSGSGGIVVANLSSSYWVEHWLMGRRVLQPSTAAGQYTMTATAYGATVMNGGAGTGLTASGTVPREGYTVAVDPNVIPLGTQLRIECSSYPQINGVYVAEDTGGAIKAKRIDIYFNDLSADANLARQRMYQFGKREVKITILN